MTLVAEKTETKTKKIPIVMVKTWAFVSPLYDLTAVEEFCPCKPEHSVTYAVFGWDHEKQMWFELTQGDYDECRDAAKEYHHNMLVLYEIKE